MDKWLYAPSLVGEHDSAGLRQLAMWIEDGYQRTGFHFAPQYIYDKGTGTMCPLGAAYMGMYGYDKLPTHLSTILAGYALAARLKWPLNQRSGLIHFIPNFVLDAIPYLVDCHHFDDKDICTWLRREADRLDMDDVLAEVREILEHDLVPVMA